MYVQRCSRCLKPAVFDALNKIDNNILKLDTIDTDYILSLIHILSTGFMPSYNVINHSSRMIPIDVYKRQAMHWDGRLSYCLIK